jgi:hypothetical protein
MPFAMSKAYLSRELKYHIRGMGLKTGLGLVRS